MQTPISLLPSLLAGCLTLAACPSNSDPKTQPSASGPAKADGGNAGADAGDPGPDERPAPAPVPTPAAVTFSNFGPYQALPAWSTWCGLAKDPTQCAQPLAAAVESPGPTSRPTVRGHGWHLWAAIWTALEADGTHNDGTAQRTNLAGTTGCWSKFDGGAACSGAFPIWMTWPNTGRPTTGLATTGAEQAKAPVTAQAAAAATPKSESRRNTLREINRAFTLERPIGDPDPTQVSTVDTQAPTYALPPLVLSKQCGMSTEEAATLLAAKNYTELQARCEAAGAEHMFCPPSSPTGQPAICDGVAFVNQGDVMIATESLSEEGYTDIQQAKLYGGSDTLAGMYADKKNKVAGEIGNKFISTKHMFWPVKGCRPGATLGEPGCRIRYGALPPWTPSQFEQAGINLATNADYLGYEKWQRVVAIDSCLGAEGPCPTADQATLELAHVSGAGVGPITTKNPEVYPVGDFLHVQISEEVLEQRFTAADRALLDQATIWAYGDASNGFEPGDFLVVAAMHVNTKEIDSWAFQSVWWSPMTDKLEDCPLTDYRSCYGQTGAYAATATPGEIAPNPSSGLDAKAISEIDAQVGGAWRKHYLMTDSYGIGFQIDGTPVSASNYFEGTPPSWVPPALLPVSMNVYIEPVIHPLGTNCQNCHRRAGFPAQSCAEGGYPAGCGLTNYQTAQCAALLGDYDDTCMTQPWAWHDATGNHCKPEAPTRCDGDEAFPVISTDLMWIVADGHIQQGVR